MKSEKELVMLSQTSIEEIDIRGQICPSTMLTALREVNNRKADIKGGKTCLTLLSDNRSSVTNITETVGRMGYQVDVKKEHDYYRVSITGIS